MRIIKYIFLLILLAIIGASVYIATQKSEFDIKKSVVINVPKIIVFNYMNDYKNWEDWGSWKEDDATMKFTYPDNTVGQGASYSWEGRNGDGKTITTFVKQNDSIVQKVNYSGNEYNSFLTFKDTVGGTKVTWISKGSVDFMTKVNATFSGGINSLMGTMFERSLNNLNRVITKEINTYDVKINGIAQFPGKFYIKQTTICKPSEMENRLHVMLPKVINFFKNNNLVMNGKPFVIYELKSSDTIKFSVCGPLREEIYISPGSDISTGFIEPFSALKTTLTGDYSHKAVAQKKALEYISKNNIERNTALKDIDVYIKSGSDIKNPSKWQTEILIPIKSVATPVTVNEASKPVSSTPINTTSPPTKPKVVEE